MKWLKEIWAHTHPFSILNGTKTDALPNGDAKLAWKSLKEKYQVENAATKIEL